MIRAIVFDLDGTLYRGESVVEGALDTIAVLEQNYRIFYLTNNSGKRRQQIADKLRSFGFCANTQNTYSCSYAIYAYLLEEGIRSVCLVGADGLRNELVSQNIRVENSSDVPAVVVGFDPFFSYGKIVTAFGAIRNGAKLIVANTDPSYPVENNQRLPGCGAMVGAIVGATGHIPDFHVGKPNAYMLRLLCKERGLSVAEICMVGDEPESDIKMAVNFGCEGILFDPNDVFKAFRGNKVRCLREIIPLFEKGEQT